MIVAVKHFPELLGEVLQGECHADLARMVLRVLPSLTALTNRPLLICQFSLSYFFEQDELIILKKAVIDNRMHFLLR